MADFCMPSLGADMEAGTLVAWEVKVGDPVKRGDIVAVVETHKGAIEIEVFETGVVAELRVAVGEKVPVGTVLAVIAPAGDVAVAPAPVAPPAAPVVVPAAVEVAWKPGDSWIRSSPAARHRAQELHVDLATVKGTGPHGAVTRPDVERASGSAAPIRPAPPAPRPAPAMRPDLPAAGMRLAIAAAMAKSNREIPHYYLGHTVDLHHALAGLATFNQGRSVEERVLPAALMLQAFGRCLPRFPELNGAWTDHGYKPAKAVHIGVAVSLRGGGLVVPALHDADSRDLVGIMADLRDLVARARAGRLRGSDLADGTITLTNLGDQGVESVYGVIYPGQSALIGVGRVVDRPWAVDGMLAVRPVVHLTLAGDHRASDGHRGAQFLAAVDRFLQEVKLP